MIHPVYELNICHENHFINFVSSATITLMKDKSFPKTFLCQEHFGILDLKKLIYKHKLLVNLTTIEKFFFYISVPPHQLIIYDKVGRSVSDVIGPLEESSELVLTCEVRGGKFFPHLTTTIDQFISKLAVSVLWRLPNQMIEQTYPA